MAVQLAVAHGGVSYDATALFVSVTCAGAVGQVARTLDVELLAPRNDPRQPTLPVALGDMVQFFCDGVTVFDGFLFSLERDTGGDTLRLGCADRGIYLKNNEGCYKFTGQTPEAIAGRVCRDFGVPVGALAPAGVAVTRSFPGVSLYKIIQTAYTLASRQNGRRYLLRFDGDRLTVIEKAQTAGARAIRAGAELIGATLSESGENAVSQVAIYDENGTLLRVRSNDALGAQLGVMRRYLEKKKDQDPDQEAAALLEDNDVERKITVSCFGDPSLRSGDSVVVSEPLTGLTGLYWVDGDSHVWARDGTYTNKLTLDLRNVMDETEAGREVKK